MKVVTSAMMTIIVKSEGEMTLRSSPMLSTMSSIRPRVFMRMPSADDSRHLRPVMRAATALPPNLPAQATRMMSAHMIQAPRESRRPSCVRSPLYAKNIGKRNTTTKSSSFSAR